MPCGRCGPASESVRRKSSAARNSSDSKRGHSLASVPVLWTFAQGRSMYVQQTAEFRDQLIKQLLILLFRDVSAKPVHSL